MAGTNRNLGAAKRAKNDEFYTQLTDIEKELRHYRKHFRGKTVFCNCDDPFESNFFKYFVLNFNRLGLKKLISTCYASSPIAGQQLSLFGIAGGEGQRNKPYKAVVTKVYDVTGDGGVDMFDVAELFKSHENELTELQGDGDFRSEECLELLDEADIVVTNPPFSLFRDYVAVLMEHKKKFVIVGNMNAITYKEIFPLIKDGTMWTGQKCFGGGMDMIQPASTFDEKKTKSYRIDEAGNIIKNIMGVIWFTNLDIKKRHEELILVKKYEGHEDNYPTYGNYDAIEVSKTSDIPYDYDGVMGVPITFLDKYNPDQFEILGMTDRNNPFGLTTRVFTKDETPNAGDLNRRGAIWTGTEWKSTYARILIRNRHPEKE